VENCTGIMLPRHSGWTTPLALFLLLFSIYFLSYSGTLHSSDGQAMFSVAESLVRRGDYDIDQIRWMGLQQGTFGPDGELYCRKGIGTSLLAVPLAWLGLVVPWWGVVQTAMLLNVLVTALTGTLLFLFVRRLGYSERTGVVISLVFGLGTMAWPYSKYFFSEPLNGLSLLAAAYFLLPSRAEEGAPRALARTLLSGVCVGLALATRFANAVLVPIYLALLLAYLWRAHDGSPRSAAPSRPLVMAVLRHAVAFGLPLLVWAAIICAYNYARFGHPFTTGYLPEESFSAPWLTGILGLLLSPGRGLLFFCPVLFACLPAAVSFARQHRLEAILVYLVSGVYVLLYGKWFMWHGGFAWGPRFLVPILPLLCITLAPLVDGLRGRWRWAFWALFGLSAAVQLLGLSVHFIHHQEALLETGLPLFDPVTFLDPRYSPLWGTWAFVRSENLDFAWIQSELALRVDFVALPLSALVVGLCAWGLLVAVRQSTPARRRRYLVFLVLPLLVLGVTSLSLARYKNAGDTDYVRLVGHIQANTQRGDAIIQNSPTDTAIVQNHYKGHLPAYGLFEGEQPLSADTLSLLERLAPIHGRFWLIEGGLPPHRSALDRWFTDGGWSPIHYSFGDQRLTLYSRP
jgi:hypothetical protein